MHDTNKMMISSIESVYVVLERKHLKDFLFVWKRRKIYFQGLRTANRKFVCIEI